MWTRAYHDAVHGNLLITASCPVVDSKGVLRTAVGVDVSLENIMSELLDNDPNRYEYLGNETQFSFLLDDSGRIIAFPREYLGLFGLSFDTGESQPAGDSLGFYLTDSTQVVIPPVVPQLIGSGTDDVEVQLNNNTYILRAHTLHKLNWHLKLLLQESLAEKEVLLREIYHRTKNNMLVIISMLHLQAMDIDDERVKTLFWETENRIRAMSLVHKKLYQSQNLAEIDIGQYLEEMVTALVASMVIGDHVKVEMTCEHVPVLIDNVVPMGLAINEIVTNSLKHAFPDGRNGRIFVRLCQDGNGMVEVIAGDDGVGPPPDMDLGQVRSFVIQNCKSNEGLGRNSMYAQAQSARACQLNPLVT